MEQQNVDSGQCLNYTLELKTKIHKVFIFIDKSPY